MRMDEKMLFERIIELLKDDDWKEQICGMTILLSPTLFGTESHII